MNRLTAALAGEAVPADSEAHSPPGIPTSHRQRGGVTAFHGRGHGPQQGDGMARAEGVSVGSASELWNTPWQELSVRELRSLLRDLPIDRSSLPAPIENLRRDELLEALDQLQAMEW